MQTTSDFRYVNGLQLHIEAAGAADAPLVILLHGFPGFWWDWRRQIADLAARGFRVIAPDMRGYNLSDKPHGIAAYQIEMLASDVMALADSYGRSTFSLAGHDWGGIVAWWVAAQFPERMERLAILNAPHPGVLGKVLLRRPVQLLRSYYVVFFQLPLLPELLMKARRLALLRRSFVKTSQPGTFTDEDLEHYVRAWSQPGALTAMVNYYRALRYRKKPADSQILPPTLIIWGERDNFLTREVALESVKMCREGHILFLKNATHWSYLEEPSTVNQALGDFLEER